MEKLRLAESPAAGTKTLVKMLLVLLDGSEVDGWLVHFQLFQLIVQLQLFLLDLFLPLVLVVFKLDKLLPLHLLIIVELEILVFYLGFVHSTALNLLVQVLSLLHIDFLAEPLKVIPSYPSAFQKPRLTFIQELVLLDKLPLL